MVQNMAREVVGSSESFPTTTPSTNVFLWLVAGGGCHCFVAPPRLDIDSAAWWELQVGYLIQIVNDESS